MVNGTMKRLVVLFLCIASIGGMVSVVKAEDEAQVAVYYFHTKFRCQSCHKIEQLMEESLKNNFPKQLEEGSLIYKVVNVEEEGNKHFIRDYQLYAKSVVLSLRKNGEELEYKNLDKIWMCLGDKQEFSDYIREETQAFLDKLEEKD
jgi:frataxin-like iron-binding protein CyaY